VLARKHVGDLGGEVGGSGQVEQELRGGGAQAAGGVSGQSGGARGAAGRDGDALPRLDANQRKSAHLEGLLGGVLAREVEVDAIVLQDHGVGAGVVLEQVTEVAEARVHVITRCKSLRRPIVPQLQG
jgi:hypothetical protein